MMGFATRFYPLSFTGSRMSNILLEKFRPEGSGIHDTKLFRSKNLIGLSKLIANKFPDGIPIYNLACSYGHEPYTMALLLAHNVGDLKTVKEKYPVYASDRASEIIDTANNQILWIDDSNLDTLNQYNAHQHFINPIVVDVGVNEFQVSDKLFKTVRFTSGELLDEVKKIPSNIPVIVLTRNLWYYLDNDKVKNLTIALSNELAPGSILSMGNCDSQWSSYGRQTVGDYFAFIDHMFDDISRSLEERDPFWEKTTFQRK